jgi:DNA-binding Xre family transcriptional regulator
MTLDANKVRMFLKENAKSSEWLAVQLECSMSTVGKLLAGKFTRVETLIKLAQLMGVQVEDLIPSQASRTA